MDIQAASMVSSQANVLDQVGVVMLSRGLSAEQQQADELLKSLGSAAPLPEGSGQRIDLSA